MKLRYTRILSLLLCAALVIGIIKIMIELVQHFSIGSRSQQRHHHNEQQRDDERRKQLVNSEDTTKRLDEIMPDQHGRSTGKHARNRTEFIGTTPIQRAEHQRTECMVTW